MKYLSSNKNISLLGLGTTNFWYASSKDKIDVYCEAIQKYGVSVIDSAEIYGEGKCDKAVGKISEIVGRDKLYLVDKVHPQNAYKTGIRKCVNKCLDNLGTDYIDLFLLHWKGEANIEEFIDEVEELKGEGKILNWGVSNFDVSDMEELLSYRNGKNCYCNQFLYNIYTRGPEYDLLPYLKEHNIMPMAYSALGISYSEGANVRNNEVIKEICQIEKITPEALMLSFVIRNEDIVALFTTSSLDHLRDDMLAIDFDINKYLDEINKEFPSPNSKVPLKKI